MTKRNAALALGIGAVVAAVAYFVTRRPTSRTFARNGRVGLIGDSLGVGLASPLSTLLKARGTALYAKPKGATHTGQWLSPNSLRPELDTILANNVYAVVISLGTNDCYLDSDHCSAFPTRILELASYIRARGAVPVLLDPGPLPWGAKPRAQVMRAALKNAAEAADGVYIDASGYPKSDGIHYTGPGYTQWAQAIVEHTPNLF